MTTHSSFCEIGSSCKVFKAVKNYSTDFEVDKNQKIYEVPISILTTFKLKERILNLVRERRVGGGGGVRWRTSYELFISSTLHNSTFSSYRFETARLVKIDEHRRRRRNRTHRFARIHYANIHAPYITYMYSSMYAKCKQLRLIYMAFILKRNRQTHRGRAFRKITKNWWHNLRTLCLLSIANRCTHTTTPAW